MYLKERLGSGDRVQLVECLPGTLEPRVWPPASPEIKCGREHLKPQSLGAGGWGLRSQDHFQFCSGVEVSVVSKQINKVCVY